MANTKGSKMLSWQSRLKLESLLREGYTNKSEIARIIGCSRRTIYYELQRGKYIRRNSDWTEEERYSPDIAQKRINENLKKRGTQLKIGNDREYADYLENTVLEKKYSPDVVLGELKRTGKEKEFKTKICTRTFYNYIDQGVFAKLSNEDLEIKGKRKRKYRKTHPKQARASAGESIEKRPDSVKERKEFGHWEMDSVVGPQGTSKCTFLVLDERKSRYRIIIKLPDHRSESVVKAMDALEEEWGQERFSKVFKTITVDNGNEFADTEGLQYSLYDKKEKRVCLYYCHAYSSWERGTNENQNKMIRRFFPKKTNFDDLSEENVKAMQDWINDYPRRIFDFASAKEQFQLELDKLGITMPLADTG